MKGNLAEHAVYCSHCRQWQSSLSGQRAPFTLPGTVRRYAPDMPVRIHHLKLVLTVHPEQRTLSGVCHTTFEPLAQEISELFFAAQGLVIERVSVAGAADNLSFEKSDSGFTVALPQALKRGEKLELAVAYKTDNPRAGIYFTGPTAFYPTKPWQVWTQGEDDDSHFWYPVAVADHPGHKMTTEVVVTVPKGYLALSNGALVAKQDDDEAEVTTYQWLHDKPHSPYLVTLVVGKFEKLTESYKGLPVEIYFDKQYSQQAKLYFKGTADLVALYSRLYGYEYPWPGKYAQVMVQDFLFGGMENTSISTMTAGILADPDAFDEYRWASLRLNAHELCHMWHGDLITCLHWPDAWLHEGAATYGEVEAVEHVLGRLEMSYYVKVLADLYFAEDARYRRPIVTDLYKEPMDLFDRHLYQKGALVRHMIRYLLGDADYYESVRVFLKDNAFKSVETADFIKAIEKATGRNLRQFFDQWVFGAGFPEYKVSLKWDEQNKVATVKALQTQKLEGETGLFTMPILFSFTMADGTTCNRTITIADQNTTISFPLPGKPVMFAFDPDNWVLKKLDLTGVPKSMLVHQLHNDPRVIGRVYAAQTLATLGGSDSVAELEAELSSNCFWAVAVEAAKALGEIGAPAACKVLMSATSAEHPKVRRAVVTALGNFKDEEAAQTLSDIICGGTEKSIFVLSEAAHALGKTKSSKAFPALAQALQIDSWLETVKVGALNGLSEIGDERSAELVIEYSAAGKPLNSRPAAITALGKLAATTPQALAILHDLAGSEEASQFTLLRSVIDALGEAKNPESRLVLDKLLQGAADGRIKRSAALALTKLERTSSSHQQWLRTYAGAQGGGARR